MKKSLLFCLFISCFFSVFASEKIVNIGINIPQDKKTGRYFGYEYEYFQEIAKYTGWTYKFIPGTKFEHVEMLRKNEVDLIIDYPDFRNDPDFVLSKNCYKFMNSYIFKRVEELDVNSDNEKTLSGKKIGLIKSSPAKEKIIQLNKERNLNLQIVEEVSFAELMKEMLETKSLDLVCIADYFAADYSELISVMPLYSLEVFLCFNKNNESFLKDFNKAQDELNERKPFYLRRLKENYFEYSNMDIFITPKEREWILNNDKIIAGFVKNGYPFCDVEKSGNVVGFLPEYLNRLLKEVRHTDLKVEYAKFDSYEEMVDALHNKKIDLIFPIYDDNNEVEKDNLQRSSMITEISLGLIYKKNDENKSFDTIISRKGFEFLNSYSNQYLPEYERINIDFAKKINFKSLLKNGNALLLSENTILFSRTPLVNKEYGYIQLEDKCPIAFGVRRDDIGLLNLLDRGIRRIEPTYVINTLNNFSINNRDYSFTEFIRENLFQTFVIFLVILAFVFVVIGLYIKEIQNNKKYLEKSKQELNEALKLAETASQAKSTFLNNVSHDMRTPMNAIIGFTELAQKSITDTLKVKDYLSKIQVSSIHLLDLINDVLDMGRIESGKVILENNPEDIIFMADELKTILQPDIDKKRIDFAIDANNIKHKIILCDKIRLNQVLLNLLSNAVKFTAEKGHVDFIIREEELFLQNKSKYKIIVRDNGIGMSEDFQRTLFEAFERENTSTISKIQGTGLGMAITKKLIEMMGGSISVKSEKGYGTEFTVVLNFSTVDNADNNVHTSNFNEAFDKKNLLKNKRILLVEDNEMNQEIAVCILQEYGFIVDVAENGEVAVNKMIKSSKGNENHYDLILMDIQMPVMNGYEATKHIRTIEDNYCRNIPIFAMTANAFEEDKKEAIFAGMNGHIAKPIEINNLINTITKSISK